MYMYTDPPLHVQYVLLHYISYHDVKYNCTCSYLPIKHGVCSMYFLSRLTAYALITIVLYMYMYMQIVNFVCIGGVLAINCLMF